MHLSIATSGSRQSVSLRKIRTRHSKPNYERQTDRRIVLFYCAWKIIHRVASTISSMICLTVATEIPLMVRRASAASVHLRQYWIQFCGISQSVFTSNSERKMEASDTAQMIHASHCWLTNQFKYILAKFHRSVIHALNCICHCQGDRRQSTDFRSLSYAHQFSWIAHCRSFRSSWRASFFHDSRMVVDHRDWLQWKMSRPKMNVTAKWREKPGEKSEKMANFHYFPRNKGTQIILSCYLSARRGGRTLVRCQFSNSGHTVLSSNNKMDKMKLENMEYHARNNCRYNYSGAERRKECHPHEKTALELAWKMRKIMLDHQTHPSGEFFSALLPLIPHHFHQRRIYNSIYVPGDINGGRRTMELWSPRFSEPAMWCMCV